MYDSDMLDHTTSPSKTQSLLLATFRKLIKPMVRLFLAKGVTYPLLLEEIKRSFVEVAEEEFKIAGKPQTDSRLTLLTGVHRRDVHRIRTESVLESNAKPNFSALIIAQWLANPRYLDAQGQPKLLARTQKAGDTESFESLVASVSKDIRARPVLDEWLRTEIVTMNDAGLIQLNTAAFIPATDLNDLLFFLGMNIHDHLAAAVNNTLNNEKMFERCVYYDQLTLAQAEHLHAWIKEHGMALLKSANQQAMQSEDTTASTAPRYRMNTGVYFYYEPSVGADHEPS